MILAEMIASDEYQQGYSVGFSRGVEQGRADKEKELQGISDLGALYSEIRADERAKVLDEFRKRINEYLNESSDFADFVVTDGAIDTVIEQLKSTK